MNSNEEIWQSIRMMKKPNNRKELDQTRVSENGSFIQEDKENIFKIKDTQCQCSQKLLQLKKECLIQIRELKAEHQEQIEELQRLHQAQLNELSQKYESEIESLQEEIENTNICNNSNDELQSYFENEQEKDREIFKKQLDHYISLTITLEQQLDQCRKELQKYNNNNNNNNNNNTNNSTYKNLTSTNTSNQQQNPETIQFSVHKNCATQLYRDTNRKIRLQTDIDRSTLYEDSGIKSGFCNSIKNFNANVKLIERSVKNQ